ncbi:hypothetical protein EPN96_06530 [bacterium]|nr:MAG: hypothetical protein EPN96_06530 [bacterium]
MELSRAGEGATRRQALSLTLAQAVREAVRRHLSEEEYQNREDELGALFFSSPSSFIIRHNVLNDTVALGSLLFSVAAEIDEAKILDELQKKGFKVFALKANPRLLILHKGGQSAKSAEVLAGRLRDEGFYVAEGGSVSGGEESLSALSQSRGCNAAAMISTGNGAQDSLSLASFSTSASFSLLDARTKETLGSGSVTASGGSVETQSDYLYGELGTLLHNEIIAALNRSGWIPGTSERRVEIRVTGLDSPALVEELEDDFYSLAEFKTVKLKRVEPGAALFDVTALDSGIDYSLALATLELEGGKIEWSTSFLEPGETSGGAGLVLVEGRWTRQR